VVVISTQRTPWACWPARARALPRRAEFWRALPRRRASVSLSRLAGLAPACREILRRRRQAGVDRPRRRPAGPDGSRESFVDAPSSRPCSQRRRGANARVALAARDRGGARRRHRRQRRTLEGLADELFTYGGSGTIFTRERYVVVRRLCLDDYDAADDLIARGVAEGFLAPRSPDEIERVWTRTGAIASSGPPSRC
jgi:hypothetical protein